MTWGVVKSAVILTPVLSASGAGVWGGGGGVSLPSLRSYSCRRHPRPRPSTPSTSRMEVYLIDLISESLAMDTAILGFPAILMSRHSTSLPTASAAAFPLDELRPNLLYETMDRRRGQTVTHGRDAAHVLSPWTWSTNIGRVS